MGAYADPRLWAPARGRVAADAVLAAAFVAGRVADVATTAYGLAHGAVEANAIPAAVMAAHGGLGMLALQLLGSLAVLGLAASVPDWRRWMLTVGALASWGPPLWNVALMLGWLRPGG